MLLLISEAENERAKVEGDERSAVQVSTSSIKKTVQSIVRDVGYLSEQENLIELLSARKSHDHDHLETDWIVFSRAKGIYDQVRWLDISGQERVRVDFKKGRPVGVPAEQLQNKGKRYYFTDAVNLDRGQVFISPLDLNIERGEIEQPRKPMIRVGTPVFDRDGIKQGIVLLNYLANALLDEIQSRTGDHGNRVWLVNRDGYWLKGASSDLEWGFMFQRPDKSMPAHYPDAWKRINESERGQFEDDQGLWTFSTIYPLVEGQRTSTGTSTPHASSQMALEAMEYSWKTVLLLPHSHYVAPFWRTGIKLFLLTALLMGLALLRSWWLAQAWEREARAKEELHHLNLNLERTVAEQTAHLRLEIAERKKAEKKLKFMATHDDLTGLPTRVLCLDHISQAFATAHRHKMKTAVLFIDLDGFKAVNDTLGHDAGDALLKGVGKRLVSSIREVDTAARIGGDEFVVVLVDIGNRDDVATVAGKLIDLLSTPFPLSMGEATIGASIGIAIGPNDGQNPEILLQNADSAMYAVKSSGKNNYRFFSEA